MDSILRKLEQGASGGAGMNFSALQSLGLSRGSIMHKSLVSFHADPNVKVDDTSAKSTRTIAKV